MATLQDIDISTNNKKKMRIILRNQDSGFFVSLQELITDGFDKGLYFEFSSPPFKFNDANTAFDYAVKALRLFLSYDKADIESVNNPCNCQLLSLLQQQSVLSSVGLTILPSLNDPSITG
jgi:hypothetical protein